MYTKTRGSFNMTKIIKEFKAYLQVEKGLSSNTIQSYIRDTMLFVRGIDVDVLDADIHVIREYLAKQQEANKAKSTISRYICSIKEFYRFAEVYHGIVSPAKGITSYNRSSGTLPKNLSMSEMSKFLEVVATSRIKTRTIIELLYGTGCRVSELINLKVEDFDFQEGLINILGKGDKERIVPMTPSTSELVSKYLSHFKVKTGLLFTMRGNPSEPMSRISVTNLTKDIAKRAGISSTVSAHVMRHSYATHMLENGCDMATMQELLGHSDMKTTKIYARVTTDLRRKAVANFHPLSQ